MLVETEPKQPNPRRGGGRHVVGRYGEDLAAQYLLNQGFEILERNWRCPIGELDLIVKGHDSVVAVEVKTRQTMTFGGPLQAITTTKAQRLRRLLASYLHQNPNPVRLVRVDLVAIFLPAGGPPELQHLKAVA